MKSGIPSGRVVIDGNLSAAYGALLCKPEVISAYPVTPQSPVVESLSKFHARGLTDAEFVPVEGENSAMGVMMGASAAGARVFTATSGLGLNFMFDAFLMAGRRGLPIVMVNVCRDDPPGVAIGEQDIMGQLDAGWIHIHVENCQEILDSIIMAYRLAEDPEVLLPVVVCYDGWYLSYQSESVSIPSQEEVMRFVPYMSHLRPRLDPDEPMSFSVVFTGQEVTEVRYKQMQSMEKVKHKIELIDAEFNKAFGRGYGGRIDTYRAEDADLLLMTMGSCTGTARQAVDNKRDEGISVGLVKVRLFRPFPQEELAQIVRGRNAVGIIDRNVCFGWNCGHLFMESKAALYGSGTEAPLFNFIGGIQSDITTKHIERVIDRTFRASQGERMNQVTWLDLE